MTGRKNGKLAFATQGILLLAAVPMAVLPMVGCKFNLKSKTNAILTGPNGQERYLVTRPVSMPSGSMGICAYVSKPSASTDELDAINPGSINGAQVLTSQAIADAEFLQQLSAMQGVGGIGNDLVNDVVIAGSTFAVAIGLGATQISKNDSWIRNLALIAKSNPQNDNVTQQLGASAKATKDDAKKLLERLNRLESDLPPTEINLARMISFGMRETAGASMKRRAIVHEYNLRLLGLANDTVAKLGNSVSKDAVLAWQKPIAQAWMNGLPRLLEEFLEAVETGDRKTILSYLGKFSMNPERLIETEEGKKIFNAWIETIKTGKIKDSLSDLPRLVQMEDDLFKIYGAQIQRMKNLNLPALLDGSLPDYQLSRLAAQARIAFFESGDLPTVIIQSERSLHNAARTMKIGLNEGNHRLWKDADWRYLSDSDGLSRKVGAIARISAQDAKKAATSVAAANVDDGLRSAPGIHSVTDVLKNTGRWCAGGEGGGAKVAAAHFLVCGLVAAGAAFTIDKAVIEPATAAPKLAQITGALSTTEGWQKVNEQTFEQVASQIKQFTSQSGDGPSCQ